MSELEKIADRLLRWKIDWVPLPLDGAAEAKVRELDAILRDLRGVKVVLPKEIVSAMKSGSYPNLVAGFNPIKNAGLAMMGDGKITFATTPEQAIAALAEKITKEKG